MAEREGFEPSEEITPFAGLANLWFKPLTHLSMSVSLLVIRQNLMFSLTYTYTLFLFLSATLTRYPNYFYVEMNRESVARKDQFRI